MSAPMLRISPEPIWSAPNHTTATLAMLTKRLTVGNISDCSRPPVSAVRVRLSLPSRNLDVSSGSRTNALTTRMPVSCSRRISLIRSIFSCITRKVGVIRTMMEPCARRTSGMVTMKIHDRPMSWRIASITPPTAVNGAASRRVQVMSTSIWTCCTSFVMRVMSEGGPKWFTSRLENSLTRWKRSRRVSRPKPIAAFEPTFTAATEKTSCTRDAPTITAPTRQM